MSSSSSLDKLNNNINMYNDNNAVDSQFIPRKDATTGINSFLKKILGKAQGSKAGLWVRGESQRRLGHVGKLAGRRGGLVIIFGIVSLALLCVGIQNIRLDTTLDSLWTPDSGRLQLELSYVSKISGLATDSDEMLIQTPKKDSHHSILNAKALLEHLDILQRALSVTIDLYDLTWGVKDLCISPNIPSFEVQFIDQIFEKVFPCAIVTPLDCFWEGAKLLGPDFPIHIPGIRGPIKWTNLNPEELLRISKTMIMQGNLNVQGFNFETLEGFMSRARIGSGYQHKPCLNPLDPECPTTSPNKATSHPPDVAGILSEGCYGFAPTYMHWAPDLIIGGQVHSKSGALMKAGGLMSTVKLMSSSELFAYSRGTWRLHHIEWNEDKAKSVLEAWQSRFASEVARLTLDEDHSSHFNFYSFTAAVLDSVVESASQFSWIMSGLRVAGVALAAVLVAVFLNGSLKEWKLRFGLAFAGVAIAMIGTTAGCGVAGFLKVPFNVATVQVLPYLAIALASQVFFILLHSQLNCGSDAKSTLKRHGFSLGLGVLVASVLIGAGGLFPIPAVRSLALQGSIMMLLSSLSILLLFPAICQIVLKRCKLSSNSRNNLNNASTKSEPMKPVPLIPMKNNNICGDNQTSNNFNPKFTNCNGDVENQLDPENECKKPFIKLTWTERYFVVVDWKWFSGCVFLIYLIWIGFSCAGITQLRLGLPITDVVPTNSSEWEFLTAQRELFPVYHMTAVTKANFDYPNNQKLLHKFHETMSGLPWIVHDDNGGKPPMWLSVFRSWLSRLQTVFDEEWKRGFLHKEEWTVNASADGILAWKLAVQTGHIDHPVDVTQLPGNRLVDSEGVINPRAFYVYLTAWAGNDPLAYGSTASNLKPEPREWVHVPEDKVLKIPKSSPIKYAEISYILRTNKDENTIEEHDTESEILSFVQEIRTICSNFEARGLPVFPWGIPFRFYEQYINLPMNSGMVIGVAALVIIPILFFSLGISLRPVGIVTTIGLVTLVQIAGLIGWLKVGLNALPVEIALLGVSLVVFSTIQMIVAYCCIPGPISSRRSTSFTLVGPPCVQSLVLISLAALILYSPNFTFIFTHFTLLISISALMAVGNLLLLLPVLLSVFNPNCWLIGTQHDDPTILLPLTPSPVLKRSSSNNNNCRDYHNNRNSSCGRSSSRNSKSSSSNNRNNYNSQPYQNSRNSSSRNSYRNCGHNRAPSENSLSTITEEPTSCATRRSAEIIVQPQVVVETFDNSSTKTKVSAKLKVEVHHTGGILSSSSSNNILNSSTNMSENLGTSASSCTSSGSYTSGSTSSSASSSTSSYNE